MTDDQIKLKIHEMLHSIYARMFTRVLYTARNCVEYRKDKPEEVMKEMENIANPEKWDYSGLLSKEDKRVLETLEYLLSDRKELSRYKEWKPINQL